MRIDISIVIAAVSLCISFLNLWFTQRVGQIRMTRPNRIQLFETAITFDALIYCTSSRGRPLEFLVLKVGGPNGEEWFREWTHWDSKMGHVERQSIFVPNVGVALQNQWYWSLDHDSIEYVPGDYTFEVHEPRKKTLYSA
jgi:hypothetical protein